VAFRAQIDDFAGLYERTYQRTYRTVFGICVSLRNRRRHAGHLRLGVSQSVDIPRRRPRRAWSIDAVNAASPVCAVGASPGPSRSTRTSTTLDPRAATPRADLQRALLRLQPQARAAVVLRYYLDLDYAAIAAILGTSSGNVGSLLSRALARMRREMVADGPAAALVAATTEEAGHGR
jgi:RNA polymerase sigma factor (sigma-70 family)